MVDFECGLIRESSLSSFLSLGNFWNTFFFIYIKYTRNEGEKGKEWGRGQDAYYSMNYS